MERTNMTRELRERNFERKYGLVCAFISSLILVALLAIIYTTNVL